VAVDPEQDDTPVRRFTTFSDDLYRLADWLQSLQVQVVAMEATGVYWIPLYEILYAPGFQVYLVNSQRRDGSRIASPTCSTVSGFGS
jgi:transposase